jgi:menaquinone-dependent protoporphyrinogen IX oxidase
MKTLITYANRFDCTEKCTNKLAEKLTNDVGVINLKNK